MAVADRACSAFVSGPLPTPGPSRCTMPGVPCQALCARCTEGMLRLPESVSKTLQGNAMNGCH